MKYDSVVFREYDIRGIYDEHFDLLFAEHLGYCFAELIIETSGLKNPKIALGHDARLSSPALKEAVSTGFRKAGADVHFLGLVTSPILYFATFELPNIHGGLMITGSHNPPEYNGFKLSVGNQTIFGEEIQKLRSRFEKNLNAGIASKTVTGKEFSTSIFDRYVQRYADEFKQTLSPMKIVLDCGNGAAGCIVRKLYEACGLHPEILFEEPDGRFPHHHPDPTVEKNLLVLQKTVRESGAIAGIGFDGDADRIGVVDHQGNMIYGDELMVILSQSVLRAKPGSSIIGDVKCSDRMFQFIEQAGGRAIVWKTGHSLIKEKIKVEKAPFGGEMSGHIFFADRNYGTDDALYAGLRLCETLSQTKKTIPELLSGLPPSFNTPELRIDTTEQKKIAAVEMLKAQIQDGKFRNRPDTKVNDLDGIRISFPNGWALVRSSNTQPVVVMRFESNTKEGLNTIRSEIESIVNPALR